MTVPAGKLTCCREPALVLDLMKNRGDNDLFFLLLSSTLPQNGALPALEARPKQYLAHSPSPAQCIMEPACSTQLVPTLHVPHSEGRAGGPC